MIKKISLGLSAVLVLLLCAGCKPAQLPNTYVAESDFPYMDWGDRPRPSDYAHDGETNYFVRDGYVYFLDEDLDVILPLCNKADCLHDKETDPEKFSDCNACMKDPVYHSNGNQGITYCNGYLYCVDAGGIISPPALYRLSVDGTKRELLYQWGEHTSLHEWIIHRDVLYYADHTYTVDETTYETIEEHFSVMALPLNGLLPQPEIIHTLNDNWSVNSIEHFNAYGNYIYFSIWGVEKEYLDLVDEIPEEEALLNYLILKTFIYSIPDQQVHELTPPDGEGWIQSVTFWNDKLFFCVDELIHFTEPMAPGVRYLADLDGTNAEVLLSDTPHCYKFISDGVYLYQTNSYAVDYGYEENSVYQVFDRDLQLVDTFALPYDDFVGCIGIGPPDKLYYVFRRYLTPGDESSLTWGVACWDKSGIGTYNGRPFDVTKTLR